MLDMPQATPRNATLREIAEAANLSVTTVWKALGDGGDINPETRERVLALSQRLNYKSNKRVVENSSVLRIGLVLVESQPHDPAPAAAVHFLAAAAPARGVRLEVALIQASDPAEQARRLHEVAGGVQGLLLYGVITHAFLREAAMTRLPCVVMGTLAGGRAETAPYGHLVAHDARAIGEAATAALIAAGHRRIGFVSVEASPGLWAERWLAGYRHAHADAGLTIDPHLIYVAREHMEVLASNPGGIAARALAALAVPPTAFVVPDPETAGTLVRELTAMGRRPANDALITVAAHGEEVRFGVDQFALVRAEDGPWITTCLEVLMRACQHRPTAPSTVTFVPFEVERFPPRLR
jgi:DNA-binding LacI/PurR family transcriptional regulator